MDIRMHTRARVQAHKTDQFPALSAHNANETVLDAQRSQKMRDEVGKPQEEEDLRLHLGCKS
eukprot:1142657-Pelagomonas_calceolata.AAC.7